MSADELSVKLQQCIEAISVHFPGDIGLDGCDAQYAEMLELLAKALRLGSYFEPQDKDYLHADEDVTSLIARLFPNGDKSPLFNDLDKHKLRTWTIVLHFMIQIMDYYQTSLPVWSEKSNAFKAQHQQAQVEEAQQHFLAKKAAIDQELLCIFDITRLSLELWDDHKTFAKAKIKVETEQGPKDIKKMDLLNQKIQQWLLGPKAGDRQKAFKLIEAMTLLAGVVDITLVGIPLILIGPIQIASGVKVNKIHSDFKETLKVAHRGFKKFVKVVKEEQRIADLAKLEGVNKLLLSIEQGMTSVHDTRVELEATIEKQAFELAILKKVYHYLSDAQNSIASKDFWYLFEDVREFNLFLSLLDLSETERRQYQTTYASYHSSGMAYGWGILSHGYGGLKLDAKHNQQLIGKVNAAISKLYVASLQGKSLPNVFDTGLALEATEAYLIGPYQQSVLTSSDERIAQRMRGDVAEPLQRVARMMPPGQLLPHQRVEAFVVIRRSEKRLALLEKLYDYYATPGHSVRDKSFWSLFATEGELVDMLWALGLPQSGHEAYIKTYRSFNPEAYRLGLTSMAHYRSGISLSASTDTMLKEAIAKQVLQVAIDIYPEPSKEVPSFAELGDAITMLKDQMLPSFVQATADVYKPHECAAKVLDRLKRAFASLDALPNLDINDALKRQDTVNSSLNEQEFNGQIFQKNLEQALKEFKELEDKLAVIKRWLYNYQLLQDAIAELNVTGLCDTTAMQAFLDEGVKELMGYLNPICNFKENDLARFQQAEIPTSERLAFIQQTFSHIYDGLTRNIGLQRTFTHDIIQSVNQGSASAAVSAMEKFVQQKRQGTFYFLTRWFCPAYARCLKDIEQALSLPAESKSALYEQLQEHITRASQKCNVVSISRSGIKGLANLLQSVYLINAESVVENAGLDVESLDMRPESVVTTFGRVPTLKA